jgi:hypothetical protein
MEATSPIFAALGVVEFDALNDLARWLDGLVEPVKGAGRSDWPCSSGDQAGASAGREG